MKILDLEDLDIKFEKNEVLKNIKEINKKYGDSFYIKYKKIKLPVYLYKQDLENKKRNIFILKYATKNPPNNYPFLIQFNYFLENSNNVFISKINKISKDEYPDEKPLSGSDVVEFVLTLLKKLYVEKAYLFDGASIKCKSNNIWLSDFKLLEKKRTFYMKFGFKPELLNDFESTYTNINSFTKILNNKILFIKKIKIEDVRKYCEKIINLIVKIYIKNDFDNVQLLNNEPNKYTYRFNKINKKTKIEKLSEKLNLMIELLDIFPKNGLLWKWLKKSFYKDCTKYYLFWDKFIYPKYSGYNIIEYKNKIYKNPYEEAFELLSHYGRNKFVIDLSKK